MGATMWWQYVTPISEYWTKCLGQMGLAKPFTEEQGTGCTYYYTSCMGAELLGEEGARRVFGN
jgi:hypothetical protein